jgi:recombination protein RecT
MAQTQEIQKHQPGPLDEVKKYLANPEVKDRLDEMLGKRSAAFSNSVINVISSNKQLRDIAQRNPNSIMRAVIKAATVNMPIEPALGWAAIVPYGDEAVFQFMYKGITQLAIRSGQYAALNCTEIYDDEIKSYNPITGKVEFNDAATFKHRYEDDRDKYVVGHYVYFRLLSGFEHSGYMTHKEVLAHAKKYSKAYQYDIRAGKKTSAWSTDPIPMGNKTVLLREIKRYGIMSIEMQDAVAADQESFDEAQAEAVRRIESEQGSIPIDTTFEANGGEQDEERDPETQAKIDAQKKALAEVDSKDKKAKRGKSKKTQAKAKTDKPKDQKPAFHCDACNRDFDQVKAEDKAKGWQCPHCFSWRVHLNNQEEVPEFMND